MRVFGRKSSKKPASTDSSTQNDRERAVSSALDQGIYNKATGIRKLQRKRSHPHTRAHSSGSAATASARAPDLDEMKRGRVRMEGWLSTRGHLHEASVSSSKSWHRCFARLRGTTFEVFDAKPADSSTTHSGKSSGNATVGSRVIEDACFIVDRLASATPVRTAAEMLAAMAEGRDRDATSQGSRVAVRSRSRSRSRDFTADGKASEARTRNPSWGNLVMDDGGFRFCVRSTPQLESEDNAQVADVEKSRRTSELGGRRISAGAILRAGGVHGTLTRKQSMGGSEYEQTSHVFEASTAEDRDAWLHAFEEAVALASEFHELRLKKARGAGAGDGSSHDAAAATADSTALAQGWSAHIDADTGATYFYHAEREHTTWDRSEATQDTDKVGAQGTGAQVSARRKRIIRKMLGVALLQKRAYKPHDLRRLRSKLQEREGSKEWLRLFVRSGGLKKMLDALQEFEDKRRRGEGGLAALCAELTWHQCFRAFVNNREGLEAVIQDTEGESVLIPVLVALETLHPMLLKGICELLSALALYSRDGLALAEGVFDFLAERQDEDFRNAPEDHGAVDFDGNFKAGERMLPPPVATGRRFRDIALLLHPSTTFSDYVLETGGEAFDAAELAAGQKSRGQALQETSRIAYSGRGSELDESDHGGAELLQLPLSTSIALATMMNTLACAPPRRSDRLVMRTQMRAAGIDAAFEAWREKVDAMLVAAGQAADGEGDARFDARTVEQLNDMEHLCDMFVDGGIVENMADERGHDRSDPLQVSERLVRKLILAPRCAQEEVARLLSCVSAESTLFRSASAGATALALQEAIAKFNTEVNGPSDAVLSVGVNPLALKAHQTAAKSFQLAAEQQDIDAEDISTHDEHAAALRTVGDWAQYADDNGGDLYWHNATTGESSWDLPPAVAAAQQHGSGQSTYPQTPRRHRPAHSVVKVGIKPSLVDMSRQSMKNMSSLEKKSDTSGGIAAATAAAAAAMAARSGSGGVGEVGGITVRIRGSSSGPERDTVAASTAGHTARRDIAHDKPSGRRRNSGGGSKYAVAPITSAGLLPPLSMGKANMAKYSRMKKAGLPEGAIRQKMKMDDIDGADIDSFFCTDGSSTASVGTTGPPASTAVAAATAAAAVAGAKVAAQASTAAKDDATTPNMQKYEMMAKAGLPEGAIRQKMAMDDIDKINIAKFFGEQAPESASTPKSARQSSMPPPAAPNMTKYEMMAKAGLPEGAIRQKMMMDNVDAATVARFFGDNGVSPPAGPPGLVKVSAAAISATAGTAKRPTPSPASWQEQLKKQAEQKENEAKEKQGMLRSVPKRKIKPLYWEKIDVEQAELRARRSSTAGDAGDAAASASVGQGEVAMWWQQGDEDTAAGDESKFITNDDLAEMEKLFAVRDNPKQSRFRRLGRGGKKDKKEGEVSDASNDDVLARAQKKHADLMHALPAQRANNVEITVRKLKIDDRHIKRAILTLDTAVLDVDRVELLISVVPDTEESRLLTALRTKIRAQLEAKQKEDARNSWAMSKASANSSKRPGDADVDAAALAGDAAEEDFSGVRIAERYMLRLLSVPRVQQKLSLFELHYRGDRTAEDAKAQAVAITAAARQLVDAKAFHAILHVVRRLGNYANAGTSRGEATAFKLSFLSKLSTIKPTESGTPGDSKSLVPRTFLHYVARVGAARLPAVQGDDGRATGKLRRELAQVIKAADMQPAVLESAEKELREGIRQIETETAKCAEAIAEASADGSYTGTGSGAGSGAGLFDRIRRAAGAVGASELAAQVGATGRDSTMFSAAVLRAMPLKTVEGEQLFANAIAPLRKRLADHAEALALARKQMEIAIRDMAFHFGEAAAFENATFDLNEWFSTVVQFVTQFETAIEENERAERMQAQQERAIKENEERKAARAAARIGGISQHKARLQGDAGSVHKPGRGAPVLKMGGKSPFVVGDGGGLVDELSNLFRRQQNSGGQQVGLRAALKQRRASIRANSVGSEHEHDDSD